MGGVESIECAVANSSLVVIETIAEVHPTGQVSMLIEKTVRGRTPSYDSSNSEVRRPQTFCRMNAPPVPPPRRLPSRLGQDPWTQSQKKGSNEKGIVGIGGRNTFPSLICH
jgi:hypothetical protein